MSRINGQLPIRAHREDRAQYYDALACHARSFHELHRPQALRAAAVTIVTIVFRPQPPLEIASEIGNYSIQYSSQRISHVAHA
jgi:hypothetical protein